MKLNLRLQDSIAPQLYAKMRNAIVHMELQPGQALSEKEIAGQLGVSRQPVREAFIKLSEIGLVEVRPSRGTFITKISLKAVADARLVREAVECELARQAARLATPSDHDALQTEIDAQKDALAQNDFVAFNDHDDAFHHLIARIVDCPFAEKTVENARYQIDRVRFLSISNSRSAEVVLIQHQAILNAIIAGDSERAAAETRTHLREILVALTKMTEEHKELFDDWDMPLHAKL